MSLAQRLRSWNAPAHLGPTMVLVVTALGVFAVFWGYFNPPAIQAVGASVSGRGEVFMQAPVGVGAPASCSRTQILCSL